MRVKDLLEKLEVSLNILRLIGIKANVDIKNEQQLLLPYQVNALQRFVLKDDFETLLSKLKRNYSKATDDAYKDGTNSYFIGHIKWFSDPDGTKDFGFAYINDIGDVYFKRKNIFNSNPKDFEKDEIVIIRIMSEEISLSKKLSASRINFIEDEDNITFLLHLKIYNQVPSNKRRQLDLQITDKLVNFNKNQQIVLGQFIDALPSKIFQIDQLDFYTNLYSLAEKELVGSPFIEGLGPAEKYKIWKKDSSLISYSDIKEILVKEISSHSEICNSLKEQDQDAREELFETALAQLNAIGGPYNSYITLCSNALVYEVSLSYEELPDNIIFKLWKDLNFDISIDLVKDQLANELFETNTVLASKFKKESKENQKKVLEYALEKLLTEIKDTEETDYLKIKNLFTKSYSLKIPLSTQKVNDDIAHFLWRHQISERPIILKIYEDYWQNFIDTFKEKDFNDYKILNRRFSKDLERLTSEETTNLLAAHFYDLETIERQDYQFFKALLEFNLSEIHRSYLIKTLEKKSDIYVKLLLFIDDFIPWIDYEETVLYTGLLNSDKQKLFFKKCLSLVEKKQAFLTLTDFHRILAIDYKLYSQARNLGVYNLDFSLALILNIASKVKEGEEINQKSIFEIVSQIINDPKELLQITGFFDKCHGRQSLKIVKDTLPQEYELINKPDSNPRFAVYCEGRLAIDRNTDQPTFCENSNNKFYWCENSKCYDIARKAHGNSEWRNYSLMDIFRILNIPFSEKQYEQLVGTINKANRFFEHLNCRECGHILHPSGLNNYGFYRVSNFCCKNTECSNNENIYLSHCANGRCLDIVDSRTSVRCSTDGFGNACGWYVCNNCHACCTTNNILARADRLRQMNQDFNCPTEGHRDRQKLCCNKCGTEMVQPALNYDTLLNWLLDNRDTHPCITNSGTNQYGRHWFLWQQGDFSSEKYRETVVNFKRNGFNVPDFDDEFRNSYLIAEPRYNNAIGHYYKCKKCSHELYISRDVLPLDQYFAIKSYHIDRKD